MNSVCWPCIKHRRIIRNRLVLRCHAISAGQHSKQVKCSRKVLCTQDCLELKTLLTLHNIGKVPPSVSQIMVRRLNCTQKTSGGALWKPGTEDYICNSHYNRFQESSPPEEPRRSYQCSSSSHSGKISPEEVKKATVPSRITLYKL